MYGGYDVAFSIVLLARDNDSKFVCTRRNEIVDLGQGLRTVDLRLAFAKQIEVRPVYYENAHNPHFAEGTLRTFLKTAKNMPDLLISASSPDAGIVIVAAITTELVAEIRARHDASPLAAAAMGRLATGAALFGSALKGPERLTLQINGDGPIGSIGTDAWLLDDGTLGVRGFSKNPRADLPLNARGKFDVAGVVGAGTLSVIRSYEVGQPYIGVVPLHTGEIAEDLAAYLGQSEQIPSVVALGVLANPDGIRAAGGVLAQVLPGADEKAIATLEERAFAMPPVTTLINDGADAHQLMHALAGPIELRSHRSIDVRFACFCTRERVEGALVGMGADELRKMASERPETEATCEFCKKLYVFTSDEVITLAETLA
jgi:molecular chaperone Hsp33